MHILHICNALLLTQDNVKSKADQMNIWYGAVHILRQPPEGGEGVWQMLTIADGGGRGGKPKADHC